MVGATKQPATTFSLDVPVAVARATMRSHGWFDLRPFRYEPKAHTLDYCGWQNGDFVSLTIRADGKKVRVSVKLGAVQAAKAVAGRILGLDWDVDEFHRGLRSYPSLKWIPQGGHGRFLRSATLFEDILKALFTTNTTWHRTKAINDRMVTLFGSGTEPNRAFPRPQDLIGLSEQVISKSTGCGYRAAGVVAIANKALQHPDEFLGDGWSTLGAAEFRKLISSCHGIGPVSADYLCRVYGRSHGFAIDAYVRRRAEEVWGISGDDTEAHLMNRLRRYGSNAPLVLWLTITRQWHDAETIDF